MVIIMMNYDTNKLIYSLNKCVKRKNYRLLIAIPDIEDCFEICKQFFIEQKIDYNFSESFLELDDKLGAKLYKITIKLYDSGSIIFITSSTDGHCASRCHTLLIDKNYPPSIKSSIFAPMESLQYNKEN